MVYNIGNPIYQLHVKGSCYTIRKGNRIVKYLDGAYGHQKCIYDALKWVKKNERSQIKHSNR